MKKLIGAIVILFALHFIIYRHLTTHRVKANPEAVRRLEVVGPPEPLLNRLFFTVLLLH
ncbi:MAG TPA: hypothetical protein VG101_10530 [Puia sp.]|jgi:hypothetical protein|nr:hypothetical protein [Puia sp.]